MKKHLLAFLVATTACASVQASTATASFTDLVIQTHDLLPSDGIAPSLDELLTPLTRAELEQGTGGQLPITDSKEVDGFFAPLDLSSSDNGASALVHATAARWSVEVTDPSRLPGEARAAGLLTGLSPSEYTFRIAPNSGITMFGHVQLQVTSDCSFNQGAQCYAFASFNVNASGRPRNTALHIVTNNLSIGADGVQSRSLEGIGGVSIFNYSNAYQDVHLIFSLRAVTAVQAVPEPASWMLVGAGLLCLPLRRRLVPPRRTERWV